MRSSMNEADFKRQLEHVVTVGTALDEVSMLLKRTQAMRKAFK